MNNWYEHFEKMANTRKRKLANNTYLVVRDDGGFGVKLHDTEVVIHYPESVILDSGGWQTVTTKERMNRFSDYGVFSEKGVWYVCVNGADVSFADGMIIHSGGGVEGVGPDPTEIRRTRKAVNQYAKRYARAMMEGRVPVPSSGDCWACLMVDAEGNAPLGGPEHIHNHIAEDYFVPTILVRAEETGALSLLAKDTIFRIWYANESVEQASVPFGVDIVEEQIMKAVRKFCFRELGLSS